MFFLKNVSILLFQYLHVHLYGPVVRCDSLRQNALLQHLEFVSVCRIPVDVVDTAVGTVGRECICSGVVQCGEVSAQFELGELSGLGIHITCQQDGFVVAFYRFQNVLYSCQLVDWWVAQNT